MRRRSLPWSSAILVAVVALQAGGPAPAAGQARCSVTGERLYAPLEAKPVQWGGEVDIELALMLHCPAGTDVRRVTLSEALGADVTYAPGPGQAPATVEPGRLSWRIDPSPGLPLPLQVRYRLWVTPDPAHLVTAATTEVNWPTRVEVETAAGTEVLEPETADPLVVARRPGALGCDLGTSHRVAPTEVAVSDIFTVTLGLRFTNCTHPGLRHRAVIALDPPATAGDVADQASAVATMLAFLDRQQTGQEGLVGLFVNDRAAPRVVPPTVERPRVQDVVNRSPWGPAAAGGAGLALPAALALLPDWPFHHEVVYYLTHPGAPRADGRAIRSVLDAAAARGVEVVPVCVGSGCDPALRYELGVPTWRALRYVVEGLVKAHLGATQPIRVLRVDEVLPSYLELMFGSQQPRAQVVGRHSRWPAMLVTEGVTTTLTYRARIDRWGRFPVGGGSSLLLDDARGRATDLLTLPPAYVDVRRPPGSADDPCRTEARKMVAPERVNVANPVTVRLDVRAECQDLEPRMNIVLSLDRSASMGAGIDYDYVKMAASALAELLALDPTGQRRFGLVSHGDPPVVEIPLTNDPAEVRARIAGMVARGQDYLAQSIQVGTAMLLAARPASGPLPDEVLVLLTDGGQTYPPAGALAPAQAAAAAGIRVITVCARSSAHSCPVVEHLASDARHSFEVATFPELLEQFVELGLLLRAVPLDRLTITEDLPANVALVPGSSEPVPDMSRDGRLSWTFEPPSPLGVLATYQVRPLVSGRQRVGTWADVRFIDAKGRSGYRVFPQPEVEADVPAATGPCAAAFTRTITPTAVTGREMAELEMGLALRCPPYDQPVEVVLVVDHSASMAADRRLEHVTAAASAFLDTVAPQEAMVGLVTFATRVTHALAPTRDYEAIRQALQTLRPEGSTDLTPALTAAHNLLRYRGFDTSASVILFTDGAVEFVAGSVAALVAAADRIKADDIQLITICAGTCSPILTTLASRPELAVSVIDTNRLVDVYRDLAAGLGAAVPRRLWIHEAVSAHLTVIDDTVAPVARRGDEWDLTWFVPGLPAQGLRTRYAVQPIHRGRIPVSAGWVTYQYGAFVGQAWLPPLFLDAIGEPAPTPFPPLTPTPTLTPVPTESEAPTATATVTITSTPIRSPTAEPLARRILLPVARR